MPFCIWICIHKSNKLIQFYKVYHSFWSWLVNSLVKLGEETSFFSELCSRWYLRQSPPDDDNDSNDYNDDDNDYHDGDNNNDDNHDSDNNNDDNNNYDYPIDDSGDQKIIGKTILFSSAPITADHRSMIARNISYDWVKFSTGDSSHSKSYDIAWLCFTVLGKYTYFKLD